MNQKRQYAAHFEYPQKSIKELGIVQEWVDLLKGEYHSPVCGPHPNHAPDCVVRDGRDLPVGVEVCELVDRLTIEEDIAGKSAYKVYTREDFLRGIAGLLESKDRKDYHGQYQKIVVVIHTDEPDLSFARCDLWLRDQTFTELQRIDEAYLIFSYDPALEGYRYVKINLTRMTFRQRVWAVVKKIPAGETLTYKEVAEKAGNPRAYRAVGNILHANYDPEIPCHRVVRTGGETGGWNRGKEQKAALLRKERGDD